MKSSFSRHKKKDTTGQEHQAAKRDDDNLPPAWSICPLSGSSICGVIPSKIPISEDSRCLIDLVRGFEKPIGLVIDLTNSTCYYDVSTFDKKGIKYVKIDCMGPGGVPSEYAVNRFVYEVACFLRNEERERNCLVHCTYGYNRTGFMIVNYLVRRHFLSLTQAIEKFAVARPPGIFKPDYILKLHSIFHIHRPENLENHFEHPNWISNADERWNAVFNDTYDDDDRTIVQENHEKYTLSDDDVLGSEIPKDQQEALRSKCFELLGMQGQQSCFRDSNSISLNKDTLYLLSQKYFYATWKAVGTLYMMFITGDSAYLFDKEFNFRRVQMRFPCKVPGETKVRDRSLVHHYTLLVGEMVIDIESESKKRRAYLVYDVLVINGQSIVQRPFSERFLRIEEDVIEPRTDEMNYWCASNPKVGCYYIYDMELFSVRRKEVWQISTVNGALREYLKVLRHKMDGLIFQCWDGAYFEDEVLLEWKPSTVECSNNIQEEELIQKITEVCALPTYAKRMNEHINEHPKMRSVRCRTSSRRK